MKHVTMSRITLEQRDSYAKALEDAEHNYIPAPGIPAISELIGWLASGATSTTFRKGDPLGIIPKFAANNSARPGFDKVNENDGTHVACNGYMAAVILPAWKDDWNLSDAYITTSNGERSMIVKELFDKYEHTTPDATVSTESLKELLTSLAAHKEEYKKKCVELSVKFTSYNAPAVLVDISLVEVVTKEQAMELHHEGENKAMAFNYAYLDTVARFLLCSGESSADLWYSGHDKPLRVRSGKLYALLLPLRVKWDAEEDKAS
jgi:hypothetical protein